MTIKSYLLMWAAGLPDNRVECDHPKGLPVILKTEEECEVRMRAPWEEAKALQMRLADDAKKIVARGNRQRRSRGRGLILKFQSAVPDARGRSAKSKINAPVIHKPCALM
jgi:hypothetical protein